MLHLKEYLNSKVTKGARRVQNTNLLYSPIRVYIQEPVHLVWSEILSSKTTEVSPFLVCSTEMC